MRRQLVILLCCICTVFSFGKEIGGVTLPDVLEIDNEKLLLNGAGLRKKLFIKVYAGGLYLKAKSSDAAAVIGADEAMAIRLHFIYDGVSPKKLTDAFSEGFENVLGSDLASLQKEIDAFNALFSKEAKSGDSYEIVYSAGVGITVRYNGETMGTVPGLAFKKAVFGIWLGDKFADGNLKSLKSGLIGS